MADKLTRLSDAIRLGATFRPQAFGTFLDAEGGSCAIGAAMETIGINLSAIWDDSAATGSRLHSRWPALSQPAQCPQCGLAHIHTIRGENNLYAVVVTLNNDHRWTREQIADWLEAQGY